ncbi:MAG: helicase-exonuclease AddAB subunit AddA [Clostridia bacterium]|nr:helicase-exonuclease AddAB subunit AddA [Clostridia bacterium]
MAERTWTPAQQNAINARGGTVLVSAAAGSGKTAVLVERILSRLTDPEHPIAANRLLVVTFTKAAAAEMMQRLAKDLDARLQADPTNPLLRKQALMLPTAHISTTHAFCASLLREQFHLLGISPDFKVLEEKQAALLAGEALAEYMEEAYAAHDPAFLALCDRFGSSRDDREVTAAIRQLYNFASSFPFPDAWLDAQLKKAHETTLEGSDYDKTICSRISMLIEKGAFYTDWARRELNPETALGAAYLPTFEIDRALWETLSAAMDKPRDERLDILRAAEMERLTSVRGAAGDPTKELVQDLRKHAKKALSDIQKLIERDDDTLLIGQRLAEPTVQALVTAVKRFTAKYQEKKAAANGLDFNDLEHLTIRLLYDAPDRRSAYADALAQNYDEILVDEYQDTNEVQDAIFRALSRNEQNLFYVGDVKQSIYAFRQACPRLFIQQRKRGHDYDGKHYPATITLDNNFRSRREVTGTVNYLFSLLMREEFGGIEYDQNEALVCKAPYPDTTGNQFQSELTLIDLDGKRSEFADIAEAQCIAADIERMMSTLKITDKDGERPARYSDFCILLRSKKSHADHYVKELNACGIPAYSSGRGGFFAAPEIGVMLSLLRFLDNPTLDIPLAAVMMSPLYQFTVDEMAGIRAHDHRGTLFAAVQATARQSSALGERCRAFLEQTGRWRTVSAVLTVDRLLERLYDESAVNDIYGVQKNGRQRVANLQQLYTMAHGFEENGYRGLSAFVRLCDRMEETGQDMDPATVCGGALDGVPVLSIHHSKGLEFPVVFLAGCAVMFSGEDNKGDMLLHSEMGIGLRLHDHESLIKYETPARLAAGQRLQDENIEESLRVLYVALTRAKEKLCIVSADVNMPGKIAARTIPQLDGGHLPTFALTAANSFQDWILAAAALHPDGGAIREHAGFGAEYAVDDSSALRVRMLSYTAEDGLVSTAEELPPVAEADDQLVDRWTTRLGWRYPYAALKNVPNKISVSALAHRAQPQQYIAASIPAFLQKGGLSPTGRGTAMHEFMQFADYAAAVASVDAERDRLVQAGALTKKQAASLSHAELTQFFQSELCRRMLAADRTMREFPFVTRRPAGELFPEWELTGDAADEPVAVQGVIDCAFVEDGALVIVDYKTDRVKDPQDLRDRYAVQVQVYARAMRDTLGLPIKSCLLWSFACGCAIDVPFE